MGNKIIVEFDKKELKKNCPVIDWCRTCEKEDWKLLNCHMNKVNYKIKKQNNSDKKSIEIERLKSLIKHYKALSDKSVIRVIVDKKIKECEQELKELKNGN